MRPEWFEIPQEYLSINPTYQRLSNSNPSESNSTSKEPLPPVPYSKMWPDDVHWFPLLFKGQTYFIGRADFGIGDGDEKNFDKWKMEKWWFGIREDDNGNDKGTGVKN